MALINSIHLLCDWSFCLNQQITYICYFVASHLFFCFNIVALFGAFWCCYSKIFIFSLKVALFGHVQVISCAISLVRRLKYPHSFSFPSNFVCYLFLFFTVFCCVCFSGQCNYSPFALFLLSSSCYIDVLMLSSMQMSPLPLFFLGTYILCYSCDVRLYTLSLFFLFPGPFVFVDLGELTCIFTLSPFLISSNSFSVLFIHSAFLLCYPRSHIFL